MSDDSDLKTETDTNINTPTESRLKRIFTLSTFAVARTLNRLRTPGSRRIILTLAGVMIAIALMITVSGVSLGLATQSAVQGDNVDYWIVPETGNLNTIAISTEQTRLGDTHQLTSRLKSDDRIRYATPVLSQVVPVQTQTTTNPEYILLIGVIPPNGSNPTIASLPTATLTPGDPYFNANRSADAWTGELVASQAAVTVLNTSAGETVMTATDRTFSIINVADSELRTGVGAAPVALVHLSELQTITGAANGDTASQILVSSNNQRVRTAIEGIYPQTDVVTRTGFAGQNVSTSSLPVAMGIAAFVVSLIIGVLFTATIMGLEITHDRQFIAILNAVGYTERSIGFVVALQIVTVCLIGGVSGSLLGIGGIYGINTLLARTLSLPAVGIIDLRLIPYGIATAIIIGVLSLPYPVWLARRTTITEALRL
jgi:ABC-type transport system, involved in lipoprotein release, permease component